MLMSRDEQSCLLVTYKDLKQAVEACYRDLTRRRAGGAPGGAGSAAGKR